MQLEIVESTKDTLEVKTDSITVAEILRSYLNQQGIDFAAWRMEHPDKPIKFRIQSSGKTPKKAISEAISAVKKDLADFEKLFKK